MHIGEIAELSGPLGNAWGDFAGPVFGAIRSSAAPIAERKPIALIGGGIGVAPLAAFAAELAEDDAEEVLAQQVLSEPVLFDFYAGFRTNFKNTEERFDILGPGALYAQNLIIATEDGSRSKNGGESKKGRIPDFLDPAKYAAVFACGPEPMLKAVAKKCKQTGTPCFISMERRMACGVGACLGCAIKTTAGNGEPKVRHCCADGPIFNAEEVIFDE
jgi:NAD(P)H-flavin reductase